MHAPVATTASARGLPVATRASMITRWVSLVFSHARARRAGVSDIRPIRAAVSRSTDGGAAAIASRVPRRTRSKADRVAGWAATASASSGSYGSSTATDSLVGK